MSSTSDTGSQLRDPPQVGNMLKSKVKSFVAFIAVGSLLFAGSALAQQFIYGNSAVSNPAQETLYKIDAATGAVVKSCLVGKGNGRGIVVVGNTVYYTTASNNNVYKTDFATCADNGIAFSVAGASSLSTIAFDGTNLWVGDYTPGSQKAFLYTPTGTLLNTITLANCTGNCDGLEFFQGKLISNDADGGQNYSIYSTTGVLQTPNFITTGAFSTGIAFDGTNFYVSFPTAIPRELRKYSGTTGALLQTITITGMTAGADQIEDLSADYAITLGPPPPPLQVPTLSEWSLLLMTGLLTLSAIYYLRRRSR